MSIRHPFRIVPLAVMVTAAAAHAEVINLNITLDGSQEDPPVDTEATGNGTATIDTDSNLFSWNITFSDLSAAQTAAHFHGNAAYCESAGVKIGLPNGSPIVGSQVVSNQDVQDILAGLWYVNVHTTAHPGGEIRGQVVPAPLDDPIPGGIPASSVHLQPQTVATDLTAPNWATHAPGMPDHLFVTDQDGIIWNINLNDGSKSVFMDLSDILVELGAFGPGSFDERGLLGLAFHPDFETNRLFYTYTSQPVDGPADFSTIGPGETAHHQSVITEWQMFKDQVAGDPDSGRELLRIDEPQFNHNGGAVTFGPDGMLYISLGDGGAGDDQGTGHPCIGNGADPDTILGSVLRIDPLGSNSANGQYGIPNDNPFVGTGGVDEIYAYGLRNPFRFSFDMLTGDMYLPDVGQNDIEEVNLGLPGANYGWRWREGSFEFIPNGDSSGYVTDIPQAQTPPGLTDPIAEYDHDEGISVIGGFVYRGTKIPALQGRYVFGEFAQAFDTDGRLFMLNDANEIREFPIVDGDFTWFVLGFGQDASGEVYVLVNATGVPFGDTGAVLRIATKPGDLDASGVVGVGDLLDLLSAWGACPGCPADIDNDDEVGVGDLLTLLANWG